MLAQEFAYEAIFIYWITLADITLFNRNMENIWLGAINMNWKQILYVIKQIKKVSKIYLEFSSTMFIMCTIMYMIYIF